MCNTFLIHYKQYIEVQTSTVHFQNKITVQHSTEYYSKVQFSKEKYLYLQWGTAYHSTQKHITLLYRVVEHKTVELRKQKCCREAISEYISPVNPLPRPYPSVQYTVYSVQLNFRNYTLPFKLYTVHCTLYTVHCTQYTVHCTMYTVNCTVNTVHYRVLPVMSW